MTPRRANSIGQSAPVALAALFSLWSVAGSAATTPLGEHARYFADDFASVLADASATVQFLQICKTEFPDTCGKKLDIPAKELDEDARFFKLITVFGALPEPQQRKFATADEVRQAVRLAGNTFESDLKDYEQKFLARYAAVIDVCPEKDPAAASKTASVVSTAIRLDFARYRALPQRDFTAAMESIGRLRAEHAREIRATWPAGRCARTREFGHHLFEYVLVKLKPYTKEGWESFAHKDKLEQGMEYVFGVAVSFEADAHPEILETLEKFDRGEGLDSVP